VGGKAEVEVEAEVGVGNGCTAGAGVKAMTMTVTVKATVTVTVTVVVMVNSLVSRPSTSIKSTLVLVMTGLQSLQCTPILSISLMGQGRASSRHPRYTT
jgi:hypothetical protein